MSFDQKIEGMIEVRVNDWLNILINMIDRQGLFYSCSLRKNIYHFFNNYILIMASIARKFFASVKSDI